MAYIYLIRTNFREALISRFFRDFLQIAKLKTR